MKKLFTIYHLPFTIRSPFTMNRAGVLRGKRFTVNARKTVNGKQVTVAGGVV